LQEADETFGVRSKSLRDTRAKPRSAICFKQCVPRYCFLLPTRLLLPGNASDTVLCTPTETFKVTKVESSNSTLLAAGCLVGGTSGIIRSAVKFHWEICRTTPRIDFRLSLPVYSDENMSVGVVAPSLTQVQSHSQASRAELERTLQRSTILVNETGGHFYLKETTLHQCLDQILMVISLKGWPPSAIPLKACAEDAAKHGSDIILTTYCLKHFALFLSPSGKVNLDVRRVARTLTRSLFVTKEIYESTRDLMNDLHDCLPVSFRKSHTYARPHACTHRHKSSPQSPGLTE